MRSKGKGDGKAMHSYLVPEYDRPTRRFQNSKESPTDRVAETQMTERNWSNTASFIVPDISRGVMRKETKLSP